MALGNVVARLLVRLGIDKKEFDAGSKDAKGKAKELANSLNTVKGSSDMMTGALKTAGVLGMGYLAKEAASLAVNLTRTAAQFDRIADSFDNLARQAGGASSALLDEMRRATAGTVSDMDLMLAANKGMLLGLGADVETWGKLLEVARFRARAMGLSMTQAVDDITVAIGRESRMIADNLGIIWDMDRIMRDYAFTLGKSAGELTQVERKQALMQDTIRQGQQQISEAGGLTDDAADSFERLAAQFENTKIAIGQSLLPAVSHLADMLLYILESGPGLETALRNAGIAARDAGGDFYDMAEAARHAKAVARWGEDEKVFGTFTPSVRLAGDELVELGEIARATKQEIMDVAAEMGVTLPESFQRAVAGETLFTIGLVGGRIAMRKLEDAGVSLTPVIDEAGSALTRFGQILGLVAREDIEIPLDPEDIDALGQAAENATPTIRELKIEMLGFARGTEEADRALPPFTQRLVAARKVLADLADVDVEESAHGLESALSSLGHDLSALMGIADEASLDAIYARYEAKLIDLYTGTTQLTEYELQKRRAVIDAELKAELDVYRDNADETENILAEQAATISDLRSTIVSALQATSVTPLDMGMTAIGEYVDKWDENARRLDAIAARGFAELEAHPDWVSLLKIPENVLAAGEDALKSWAEQTSADVRALFRPDLLDVDAAADAVEAYMQQQAAKEISIDFVIGELVARGTMSAEDAEKQVRQAYGLETEAVDVPINLVSAVAGEGEGEGWDAAAQELFAGLKEGLTDSSLVVEFVGYFRTDIDNNASTLYGAGQALWTALELGIFAQIDQAAYVDRFIEKLGPYVGTWLVENGYLTQGGSTP